jgi:hypothetical protein
VSKRTYKPKVQNYVPQALDGDGDGVVQDGTEFERPVGTEFDWAVEETFEAPEPVELPAENPKTYKIAEGENILTVADKFKPEGMTRQDYAKALLAKNSNWNPGALIHIV